MKRRWPSLVRGLFINYLFVRLFEHITNKAKKEVFLLFCSYTHVHQMNPLSNPFRLFFIFLLYPFFSFDPFPLIRLLIGGTLLTSRTIFYDPLLSWTPMCVRGEGEVLSIQTKIGGRVNSKTNSWWLKICKVRMRFYVRLTRGRRSLSWVFPRLRPSTFRLSNMWFTIRGSPMHCR